MRADAQAGERDLYKIPFFAILPHSGLRIEKIEVDFTVTLNGLDETEKSQSLLNANSESDISPVNKLDVPEQFQEIE